MFFATATQMARMMQFGKELPQLILVGIGYRTENLGKILDLRSRDLTPTPIRDENGWRTGGAAKFLGFIKEELKPFIQKNYRISQDAGYAGISYGGLFGLYVLFHEPETFQRYIIGSPSIWYDSLVTLNYEAEYAATHRDLHAKVFMSVGLLEEQSDTVYLMVTNMKRLTDKLLSRQYPNFGFETAVFEAETHLSQSAVAISRGLRVIYRK
jgi:predicted alpha/beta superfamily hydrolase